MANSSPAFQFYPADFVGDPNVMAMSTTEAGAYIFLICAAWEEKPTGTLPDDDSRLARIARLRLSDWKRIKANVMAAFVYDDELKRWKQKRLIREAAHQEARRDQAKNASAKRWESGSNADGKRKQCGRKAEAMRTESGSNAGAMLPECTTATPSLSTAATTTGELHPDFKAACDLWQAEIGLTSPLITDWINQELKAGVPLEWINHAVSEAALHEGRNLAYVKSIIERRKKGGKHKDAKGKKGGHHGAKTKPSGNGKYKHLEE